MYKEINTVLIRSSGDWEQGTKKKEKKESQEEQQITPSIFQNIRPSIVF